MAMHLLRLMHGSKKTEMGSASKVRGAGLSCGSLLTRLHQVESQQEKKFSAVDEIASRPMAP